MTIEDLIEERSIGEVFHFTTYRGITGILAKGAVLSRSLLPNDAYLEHILLCNCPDRSRDKDWWGYVNLSITDINKYLLDIARKKWHSHDVDWWCVLSFGPEILTHEGVFFTTTNNAYPYVQRNTGAAGLEAMFAPIVKEFDSKFVTRSPLVKPNRPTSPQAEVLYPNQLELTHLRRVCVPDEETAAKVESICAACNRVKVDCQVTRELFA